MAIQFQQLGAGDAELLHQQLARWRPGAPGGADDRRLRRETEQLLADGFRWHTWLIRRGGLTVGYLTLQFRAGSLSEAPRAQVAALYVEPGARSPELGRQALRFASDIARWLHVRLVEGEPARMDRHAAPFTAPAQSLPDHFDTLTTRAIA